MATRFLVAAMMLAFAAPSVVLAKSRADTSFTFPEGKPVTIVVMRPDVQVGSLGTSGIESPNADWTEQARKNLAEALIKDQGQFDRKVVMLGDQDGENAQLVADYQALFRAVSGAIFEHKFFGARLPTKKGKFDWTLGPGVRKLGELGGGNYGLLLYTHDSFGTGGRKAMQVIALIALGSFVPAGVHQSYASLVDLDTGQVVWYNVSLASAGDPRETDGALKRIQQLLSTMPGRKPEVPQAKAK